MRSGNRFRNPLFCAVLAVIALSSAAARAASPDAFESDNVFTDPAPDNPSATLAIGIGSPGGPRAIAPRTPQLHSLDTGGDITTADRDFVAFTLAATSDILVQADVSVGPGLLNLRLFNSTGTQLQFAQNANSSITTQLLATSLAPGNYFIGTEEAGLTSPAGAQTIESYMLTLLVNTPGQAFAPLITSSLTASGVAGTPFSYQLFSAGSGTISYTVSGLPTGLGLNGSQIIGTAQQSGTFNATVTASNGTLPDDKQTLVITINAFGIITAYAGTGAPGFSGDGDLALGCMFGNAGPQGLAVDSAGNLFIADASNGRIRRIDAVTTIITTIAGTGQQTVADGGAATAGILNSPVQATVDGSGNIFIADSLNNRIRRVDVVTGIITSYAGNGSAAFSGDGGAAAGAGLNAPTGLAFSAGFLYIADSGNNLIRRVNVATGVISTVAGFVNSNGKPLAGNSGDNGNSKSAKLDGPTAVAFDSGGNLFITDTNNNRVRMVASPADGTTNITHFAGSANGIAGFGGDTGSATGPAALLKAPRGVAADGTSIFISDSGNNRIRSVVAGTINTVAGIAGAGFNGDGIAATSAQLSFPNQLTVTPAHVIIFADTNNNRIRQFTVGGNISTFAGNGTFGFSGDGGLATSAAVSNPRGVNLGAGGAIIVTDTSAQRVRQVSAGNIITTIAGGGIPGDGSAALSSFLNTPEALAVDRSGNIFFCDTGNRRVRQLSATTGNITTIAGNGTNSFGGDGGPATSASLNVPLGIAVDGAGNVFIADELNNRIRMVNAAGTISTVAGSGATNLSGDGGLATAAGLSSPAGIAVDAAGSIYVADLGNNAIRKFTVGGNIMTLAGTGTKGFTGDGGAATAAQISQPRSVAVDATGNVFFADMGNNRVRRIDAATGIITTVIGNGTAISSGDGGAANIASLNNPVAVVFDSSGNLYSAEIGSRRVRRTNVASPPVITSAKTATGTQNAFFNYLVTGTGNPTPNFSVSTLPTGLFFSKRQISGFPGVSGATDVTLSASNILGSTSQTLRIVIARAPGSADTAPAFTSPPAAITISPNPGTTNVSMSFVAPSANDSDTDLLAYDWDFGDGTTGVGATTTHTYTATGIYTVTLSVTDGVSSISITGQAAVNDPSVTQQAIISKAQVRLNFTKQNSDLVTAGGVIPLRTGFVSNGAVVKMFFGPLSRTFTLNSKGSVSSKTDVLKIATTQKSGSFLDSAKQFFAGKFTLQLKSQSLASSFASLGLVANIPNPTPIKIPILISINNDSYVETVTFIYKSTAKSGTGAKLPEGAPIPTR